MLKAKHSSANSNSDNIYPQVFLQSPIMPTPKATASRISLEYHCQPAGETPEYVLDHYVIPINIGHNFYIEQTIDGRRYEGLIFRGATGIFPSNSTIWHRWDREANFMLLNLESELLTRNAQELLETEQVELIPQFALQDSLVQQIGLALQTELQFPESGTQLYVESMANTLAVYLLRHFSTKKQNIKNYRGGLPQHKLKLVTDYINDYLEQELTLKELAKIAQLSQYQFARVFKQSIGISPHQYVIQCRVEQAKQLLRQGKMSLAEIAIACGFTHQSHLNRHFKRLTGVTPKILLKS